MERFRSASVAARPRASRIARSMMLTLGRPPSGKERARAEEFLRRHRLVDWCRVLLNLNEFVYVD